ncbi:MAG: aromatic-ring-hydroxylating dioxygenase subunit beta [Rhizobacter sp.]|nr:aromatic-ring-hydroxylating dioxygenase subunit beta [Rhizobacter sp.]
MLLDLAFDVSTANLRPAELPLEAQRGVEQFLFLEARLLDERRFAEWLSLWSLDGMYWIPREHGQASPYDHISLAWEDAMLREVRVGRLLHARNWSQLPPTRTARLIGNVMIDGETAAGDLVVHSSFQLSEWRNNEVQQHLAGACTHKLRRAASGAWQLHMKRIDLVNCDARLPNIEVFV